MDGGSWKTTATVCFKRCTILLWHVVRYPENTWFTWFHPIDGTTGTEVPCFLANTSCQPALKNSTLWNSSQKLSSSNSKTRLTGSYCFCYKSMPRKLTSYTTSYYVTTFEAKCNRAPVWGASTMYNAPYKNSFDAGCP